MDSVKFDRKPYTVVYYKDGKKHKIRRMPPPVLHEMLPTDIVELKYKKNDDYNAGDEFTVKNINPRHPNIIQIENEDGNATFVPYFDLDLTEKVAPREGMSPIETPARNRYLLWP